ncbi:MAG: S8 family peptidase [Acidimicrobiia bacterium]
MRRAIVGALAVVVVAGVGQSVVGAAPAPETRRAWIVVLDDSVGDPAKVASEHARTHGGAVSHVYSHALKGYSATFSDRGASDVARDRRVAYVEADGTAQATATQSFPPSWGLDRIDQRALPLGNGYTYATDGTGVTAYVVDTGILTSHQDFGGRAFSGYDMTAGGQGQDCNGHGTHVAGTIGGSTYGVAKGVRLVAVRVLDCYGYGSWSGIIAGLDWIVANHGAGTPAVANMSLGGSASSAVDAAVGRVIGDGVTVAVAAGNGNVAGVAQDACKSSPARVAAAVTVGATDISDRKASWSNFGRCLDLFAPGVGITSAWIGSTTDSDTISGTSMATPHTAGAAALYLQGNPGASPGTVQSALIASTTKNVVTSPGKGSQNRLLYTGP